jgi:hypothetical protein
MPSVEEDLEALRRLLRASQTFKGDKEDPASQADVSAEDLLKLYERFLAPNDFRPGMLIKWKSGLRNRLIPRDEQLGVVVEVLTSPLIDPDFNSGTAYFREPLDIVVAIIDSEGDFALMYLDKRRLIPAR